MQVKQGWGSLPESLSLFDNTSKASEAFRKVREANPEMFNVVDQTRIIIRSGVLEPENWKLDDHTKGLVYRVSMGSLPWNTADYQELRQWLFRLGYVNPYIEYNPEKSMVTVQFEMP
ncbi:hypothetical protein [Pseudomonas phage PA1C]|nr:hypothetical protein [Pseudomonas phage PA1C]